MMAGVACGLLGHADTERAEEFRMGSPLLRDSSIADSNLLSCISPNASKMWSLLGK